MPHVLGSIAVFIGHHDEDNIWKMAFRRLYLGSEIIQHMDEVAIFLGSAFAMRELHVRSVGTALMTLRESMICAICTQSA